MQSELHGLSLSSCSSVLKSPLTARLQRSVSLVDHRVAGSSSFTRISAAADFNIKSESLVDIGAGRSLSFGRAVRSQDPMTISHEAAVGLVQAALPAHSYPGQEMVLEMPPVDFQGISFDAPQANVHVNYSDDKTYGASSPLVVVGHRGCGKNKILPQGDIPEARPSIRENTIASFNLAANNGAQFVEFDVQVTKDGVPIVFHDDIIISDDKVPRHIGEITLEEFLAMGPQKDANKVGRPLYRTAEDGSISQWTTDVEDCMCTLVEAFAEVQPSVGFNIELKFDDSGVTSDEELHRVIDAVLEVVRQYGKGRMIYFSSFHPDAVQILRKKMSLYPVFFLTDGGTHIFKDSRRNSIEAAVEVCRKGDLQGIVSEVKAVLQYPTSVTLVKSAGLWMFTYGELNNVAEAVCKQQDWGVDGVIVDHVLEIVRVARQLYQPA